MQLIGSMEGAKLLECTAIAYTMQQWININEDALAINLITAV
jgi:hypothetical protein